MLITSIFSFSHNVFKTLLNQGRSKSRLCGKGLKKKQKKIENIVHKRQNDGNQYSLIFSHCFQPTQAQILFFNSFQSERKILLSIELTASIKVVQMMYMYLVFVYRHFFFSFHNFVSGIHLRVVKNPGCMVKD